MGQTKRNVEEQYEGTGRKVVKQFGKPVAPTEVDRQRNFFYQRKHYLKTRIDKIESGKLVPREGSKSAEDLKRQLSMTLLSIKQLSGNGRGRPKTKEG